MKLGDRVFVAGNVGRYGYLSATIDNPYGAPQYMVILDEGGQSGPYTEVWPELKALERKARVQVVEHTARQIIKDVALRLARVADYAEGPIHPTRITEAEVKRAIRDLSVAGDKLDARLELIEPRERV